MTLTESALLAGLIAFITTSAAMPVVVRILLKRKILDVPNVRSSHEEPTPRGAGIAQMLGMISSWGLMAGRPGPPALGAVSFGLLGLIDDLRTQKPIVRLGFQLVLGFATMWAVLLEPGGAMKGALALGAGTILLVVVVNATNFMDGANGMSALHGFLIGSFYWVLLAAASSEWAYTAAALVGVSLAFLPWNWGTSARVFLGDSGSYLMGSVFALLAVATYQAGLDVVMALAPLSIYLVDVLRTLVIRMSARKPVMSAHRDHIYQRLMRGGWTHGSVSSTVGSFTLVVCVVALAGIRGVITTPSAVLLVGLTCLVYLMLPRILRLPD